MIDRSLNYGRKRIQQFLELSGEFTTVLDMGAGQGADLLLAREINPSAILHAVEVDPKNVEQLNAHRMHVHSLNIEQRSLPIADEAIDIVIINQVLEHVKELFWIFHEMTRVLPVGGNLIVGVPNLAALHNRILLAFGRQPSPLKNSSAHIRGFTKRDFLNFSNSCFPDGYELKAFRGSNFYPFPPVIARPLSNILPNMAWSIFFLLEKKREYRNEFLEYPVRERLETNFYVG